MQVIKRSELLRGVFPGRRFSRLFRGLPLAHGEEMDRGQVKQAATSKMAVKGGSRSRFTEKMENVFL